MNDLPQRWFVPLMLATTCLLAAGCGLGSVSSLGTEPDAADDLELRCHSNKSMCPTDAGQAVDAGQGRDAGADAGSSTNDAGPGTDAGMRPDAGSTSGPLLAYLQLDEGAGAVTFADSSGSGATGSCSGSSCPSAGVAARAATGARFDGVNDGIAIAGTAALHPAATVSVGAYVQVATTAANGGEVVSIGDNYVLRVMPDGNVETFFYFGTDWNVLATTGLNVKDGQFHHLVGQKSATELQIFIDGALRASKAATGPIAWALGPDVFIGKHGFGASGFELGGVIDEVRIYDRALTPQEIQAQLIGAPADTTPPSAVANLSASSPTASSVVLTWAAPGDDGSAGTAASYEVRFATTTITASTWASATAVSGLPPPALAGSTQTTTVSGLSAGTSYFFALRSVDEAGNLSGLSNVAAATTLAQQGTTTAGPRPTPASPAGAVTIPSAIDSTGTTDVSSALQSWFDAQPNGTATNPKVIIFPSGATYQLSQALAIHGRQYVTLWGYGVTLRTTGDGTTSHHSGFHLEQSNHVQVFGFQIQGVNVWAGTPDAWGTHGQGEYAMGVAVYNNCSDIELADLHVLRVFGDGIFLYTGTDPQNNRINIHHNLLELTGRQGVVPNEGSDITIEYNIIRDNAMSPFDAEDQRGAINSLDHLYIRHNVISNWNWYHLSAPIASSTVGNPTVVTTSQPHRFTNSWVWFNGHPGVPDGWVYANATVLDATHLQVPTYSSGGTGGTIERFWTAHAFVADYGAGELSSFHDVYIEDNQFNFGDVGTFRMSGGEGVISLAGSMPKSNVFIRRNTFQLTASQQFGLGIRLNGVTGGEVSGNVMPGQTVQCSNCSGVALQ